MRRLAVASLLAAVTLTLGAPASAARAPLGAPALHLLDAAEKPHTGSPVDAAREVLLRNATALHLDARALQHLVVDGVHDIGRGGVVVRFRHVEGGLRVWHDELRVLFGPDLRARAMGGQLHAVPSGDFDFGVGPDDAVALALGDVTGLDVDGKDVRVADGTDAAGYQRAVVVDDRFALRSLRVQPVLAPVGGVVVAAFVVEFLGSAQVGARVTPVAWSVVVDADAGRVRAKSNLRRDEAFTYRVHADVGVDGGGDHRPTDGPVGDTMPYPFELPDGHVPAAQPANLVTTDGLNRFGDPWLAADATTTVGNNVVAATDTDIDGVGDLPATLTGPRTFDWQADIALPATANDTQKMAAATSLFFLVNWLHDEWYDSGFDEAARNAQQSNLGRGGPLAAAGDPINAISQYGAPDVRDNSAMAVPDDGESPEMEMFIWSGPLTVAVTVDGVENAAFIAEFGPQSFSLSGEAVLVDDGTDPVTDACEALGNDPTHDVAGKIAVIDRGLCSFSQKVLAADVAGAIGVVIVNNVAGEGAPFLSGDPEVAASDLPTLSLSLEDGAVLKAALLAGTVTLGLDRVQGPDIDGSLDTSVAAHEWGHYLHLRQVICNSAQCGAQSEGWGDFVALLTLVREGDDLDGAFPVGAYAVGGFPDDPAYFGIRRYPYSTNLAKNPLTFRHIGDNAALPTTAPLAEFNVSENSEVHAAGELWATMMWESTTAMFAKAQLPGAALDFEQSRRRVTDIVVKGMQTAPADPTFTEMRDAVLAAASTFDDGAGPAGEERERDLTTFANAFARRGMGTCAVSPERYAERFDAVVESFTVQDNLAVVAIELDDDDGQSGGCDDDGIVDAGETGTLTVVVQNQSPRALGSAVVTVSSAATGSEGTVTFGDGARSAALPVGALAPYGTATLRASVRLDVGAAPLSRTPFSARVTTGSTCAEGGLTITPLTNADDVDDGLTTDNVEGSETAFSLDGRFAEFIWTIEPTDGSVPAADWGPGNHIWFGGDAEIGTDTALVTPVLVVQDDVDFVLHLRHRHSFEFDEELNYDGAVIEISSDDGETWTDIADATTDAENLGYNGVIGEPPQGRPNNPLDGRDGFVAQNPSYPDLDVVSANLGRAFAGQSVQVRFRIGTDQGVGADGWELDDIGFDGLDNAPFSGVIENRERCDGVPAEGEGEGAEGEGNGGDDVELGALRLSGGGCHCSSSSSVPGLAGLALLTALGVRRRRLERQRERR